MMLSEKRKIHVTIIPSKIIAIMDIIFDDHQNILKTLK